MERTRRSDPLRVDTVPVGAGRVGMTLCPGRQQPGARTGDWSRDLAVDLGVIRSWGARAVVTLLEPEEMRAVGVEDLGERVEEAGLDWFHLPARDGSTLDDDAGWLYLRLRLERLLAAGLGVVIHCMGGLGRTGTALARLLVERGEEPGRAVARVRAARPGAIETEGQMRQVLGLEPGTPLAPEPTVAERVLGCLLGGAVGDGFGYAVEFDKLEQIRARHGRDGLRRPVLRDGQLQVSDDTQMTLFTAEGLLRAREALAAADWPEVDRSLWLAYRRWLDTQGLDAVDLGEAPGWLVREPALRHPRAPGNTCLHAIRSGEPGSMERPRNSSKGCGGVMRAAPAGLVPRHLDRSRAFDLGLRLAALTHGHPSGYHPAGAMAAMVRDLVDGADLAAAADGALALLAGRPGADETASALGRALELGAGVAAEAAMARLGEGWVGEEALAIGCWAAGRGRDFAEVAALAANHDGDSDSTASIAGQLWGAWRGLDGLPQAWVRRLDVLRPLLVLGHDLAALAGGGRLVERYLEG
jgi:ADP-ribosylglycohydrolase